MRAAIFDRCSARLVLQCGAPKGCAVAFSETLAWLRKLGFAVREVSCQLLRAQIGLAVALAHSMLLRVPSASALTVHAAADQILLYSFSIAEASCSSTCSAGNRSG